MSTNIHPNPTIDQLPAATRDLVRQAADVAGQTAHRATAAAKNFTGFVEDLSKEVADATKDTYQTLSSEVEEGAGRTAGYAQHAFDATKDAARDIYQSAALKAEDTLKLSTAYMRRNPVPVLLGAIALGASVGYLLMAARRRPSFGERYLDEPLVSVREAILSALAPVAQRVHEGYDSARDGAENAINRVHRLKPRPAVGLLSDQIGRFSRHLKFW